MAVKAPRVLMAIAALRLRCTDITPVNPLTDGLEKEEKGI